MTTRKKIMKQKEMVWRNNKKLSELEEVAKERAQNLLQRANKLRMEQEEELKDMSKVGALHFFPPLIHILGNMGSSWSWVKEGGKVRDWLDVRKMEMVE